MWTEVHSQHYGFSSSHVWIWELDHKESWVPKNWYFWSMMLEKSLESPLYCKEIQPVNAKGNQSWIFTGMTDAEAETLILWPPNMNKWLIGKDPGAGKDWRQEKGMTEDEMVGWYHWLDGHKFDKAPRIGDGQGTLACCSRWGRKELDMTDRLNWLTDIVQDLSASSKINCNTHTHKHKNKSADIKSAFCCFIWREQQWKQGHDGLLTELSWDLLSRRSSLEWKCISSLY